MQRYTVVFIAINALHVSGGSSAHHQELKTVYTASGVCRAFSASYRYREGDGTGLCVLLEQHTQTSSISLTIEQHTQASSISLTIAVRSRKSSTNTRCCVYSFELLMMGGRTP